MSLSVSKWQAARRGFNYEAVLQFFWRSIVTAGLDARKMNVDGTPSDEALLARWWFATETPHGHEDYFCSFSCACHALSRDEDEERLMALRLVDGYDLVPAAFGPQHRNAEIQDVKRWRQVQEADDQRPRWVSFIQQCEWALRDNAPDFDTDECEKRLEYLLANPLADDDPEPIFEGYRVVPALDQFTLFGMLQ